MASLLRVVLFGIIVVLISKAQAQIRTIELRVDPYPVRLQENAPPGQLVLTITGYDNATGSPIQQVTTSEVPDAEYFTIQRSDGNRWFLITNKIIDKPINYTFDFNVYGTHDGVVRDRNVLIIVSKPNKFAPVFEKDRYDFKVFRNSTDKRLIKLGEVKAIDRDPYDYNANFQYFIFDQSVTKYFQVDLHTGIIGIYENIPPSIWQFNFSVIAIDNGSPQKKSSVPITVEVTHLPPPEIFCVSVEGPKARICWKDPTNGSYVEKYQLQFAINGQNVTRHPVSIFGKRNEVCTQVRAGKLEAGNRLKFTVKVFNSTNWSPSSVQRFVNITKNGLYGNCHTFSNCSVWQPCKNGGECRTKPDLSYTCECKPGWGGQNCTESDLCSTHPCLNSGTCQFVSHKQYQCHCPNDYYGNRCQYHDKCSINPCHNHGTCFKNSNGSFTCKCPPHYTGSLCELEDPCLPNPCANEGICVINATSYTCNCLKGFFGDSCEKINICELRNPCVRGECEVTGDNQYNCSCPPGMIGQNCSEIDLCYPRHQVCQNNGTCEVRNNTAQCKCPEDYYGDSCQHFKQCFTSPCQSNGKCENNPDGSYTCHCKNGYYGSNCTRFDPCSLSPCQFQGKCENKTDSEYLCTCQKERYGENCEYVNGCELQLCNNNSTCTNTSSKGDVDCACQTGYYGKFCERFDPCSTKPCEHSTTCSAVSDTDYKCNCGTHWAGKKCQYRNKCQDAPCQNSATCRSKDDGFVCECSSLYYGKICDKYEFCSPGANMCRNKARCELEDRSWHIITINKTSHANVTNWFRCLCPIGFKGLQCEIKEKACDARPCGTGHCRDQDIGHVCYCPDGTIRDNCRTDTCDASTTSDKTGRYHWPKTLPGVESTRPCPYGGRHHERAALAIRKCQIGDMGRLEWLPTDTSNCQEINAAEADERLRNLMSDTKDASKLTPEQVANITNALENVAVFALEDNIIAKEMATVISNLLETRESVLIESSSKNHSSERLVELITEYVDTVETDSNVTIETENINLMVLNITKEQAKTKSLIYEPVAKTGNATENFGVKMQFPRNLVKQKSGDAGVKIKFVTYRTSAFFIPKVPTPEEIVLRQRVMSASFQGIKVDDLEEPIHFTIENINSAENHTCVYWNENLSEWSTSGVYTTSTGGNVTECYTTHLTSFSIILDPTPTSILPEVHDRALTYISYIGCAISIFGLAFTIVTYSMFRSLNRERSGKILLNMCVSMLLMNASFILMAETTRSDGETICMVTAILLHYFLLTSLMWMVIEAINMYQALIKVFTKYTSYFILKRCIIAWGLPAVIVAITMGVNKLDNYKSKTDFCFISQANPIAFYATLLGPACVILVINTIVFTLVARVIMKPRFKGSVDKNEKVTPAQVRGAFTVMVLLGVTWVFGPVAINESKLVFNYLFTILNSLQGFLIFLFRCLMNNEARMAWVLLVKTGTFKRRRGPIKSVCGDSSSSKGYADYKVNGSSGDSSLHTAKTTIHSNGIARNGNVKNGHMNGCDENSNGKILSNGKTVSNGKHKNNFTMF